MEIPQINPKDINKPTEKLGLKMAANVTEKSLSFDWIMSNVFGATIDDVLEILKVIVNSNKIKVNPNEGPVDAILVEGLKFVLTRQLKWSEIKEPQLVKNSAAFKNFVKR